MFFLRGGSSSTWLNRLAATATPFTACFMAKTQFGPGCWCPFPVTNIPGCTAWGATVMHRSRCSTFVLAPFPFPSRGRSFVRCAFNLTTLVFPSTRCHWIFGKFHSTVNCPWKINFKRFRRWMNYAVGRFNIVHRDKVVYAGTGGLNRSPIWS